MKGQNAILLVLPQMWPQPAPHVPEGYSSLPTLDREGCSSCHTSWAWLGPPVKPTIWQVELATTSSSWVKPANCSSCLAIKVTISLCFLATLTLV